MFEVIKSVSLNLCNFFEIRYNSADAFLNGVWQLGLDWINQKKKIISISFVSAVPLGGCGRVQGGRLRDGKDDGSQRGGHDAAQD